MDQLCIKNDLENFGYCPKKSCMIDFFIVIVKRCMLTFLMTKGTLRIACLHVMKVVSKVGNSLFVLNSQVQRLENFNYNCKALCFKCL